MMNTEPLGQDAFIEVFIQMVPSEIDGDLERWEGVLEEFEVDHDVSEIRGIATVYFRGHRYRYSRQIWPNSHPVELAVGMYATFLTEMLLTRRAKEADHLQHVINI